MKLPYLLQYKINIPTHMDVENYWTYFKIYYRVEKIILEFCYLLSKQRHIITLVILKLGHLNTYSYVTLSAKSLAIR